MRAVLLRGGTDYPVLVGAAAQPPQYPFLLRLGQHAAGGHVEKDGHPCIDLVDVLAAGAAAAANLEPKLFLWYFKLTRYMWIQYHNLFTRCKGLGLHLLDVRVVVRPSTPPVDGGRRFSVSVPVGIDYNQGLRRCQGIETA